VPRAKNERGLVLSGGAAPTSIIRDRIGSPRNSAAKRDTIGRWVWGNRRGTMKCCFAAAAVHATVAVAAPTLASATSRHHYHRHAYRYGNPGPSYGYPIAPYGNATPSYSSRYGTYPSWTYDPDPNMRAQLRSEFNRGVEFPGNGGR